MEIKRAIEFDDNIREKIGELFVEAFYDIALKHFSKNKSKLVKTFTPMLILDYFYVAVIDNEIAGMTTCMDIEKGNFCLNVDKEHFIKNLGIIRGRLAYLVHRNYLGNFISDVDGKTALIEYVATGKNYRRMGVATALMKYLFALPEYENYILELMDINTNAFELYKKLGFQEINRKKSLGRIYNIKMKYSKKGIK